MHNLEDFYRADKTKSPKELTFRLPTLLQKLNKYEDVDAQVELLTKIIKKALEDTGRETIEE